MCPQQPAGFGGPPPPPPFPFPPPFMNKKKKRRRSRTYGDSYGSGYGAGEDEEYENVVVPDEGEPVLVAVGDDELPQDDDYYEKGYVKRVSGGTGGTGGSDRASSNQPSGGYGSKNVQRMADGTIVTTIDFPPGEAEKVSVKATNRRDSKQPNVDVVAELKGGKAGPAPKGTNVKANSQYQQNGATVTSYTLPKGKDGYVKAGKK